MVTFQAMAFDAFPASNGFGAGLGVSERIRLLIAADFDRVVRRPEQMREMRESEVVGGGLMSDGDHRHNVPPKKLRGFPNAVRARSKTRRRGGKKGVRPRWKDTVNGNIYEWDYRHGRVEVYDKRGGWRREADPDTGKTIKGPRRNRRIEP
jgi:hypothetical protein